MANPNGKCFDCPAWHETEANIGLGECRYDAPNIAQGFTSTTKSNLKAVTAAWPLCQSINWCWRGRQIMVAP